MFAYLVLPPAMILAIFALPRRIGYSARVWPSITVAIASALLLGVAASIIYDLWLGGIIPLSQMLLTCYWAAGLICILKMLDIILDALARFAFRAIGSWTPHERQSAAQVIRVILLFIIGLPYMIASAATYRPKTALRNATPWYDLGAISISFDATDGLQLAGFWTPAPTLENVRGLGPRWGHQTVIVCPGSRGGRAAYLELASVFLDHGYNVLTFDSRAQGDSDGQIVSFGDHERRDVLGAVRWLRKSYPQAARRIVAVGIDTGGAALIEAAADPSIDGRAIDALAVFGGYDSFKNLAASAAGVSFPPPLQWLIVPVGVPLACLQTGADLWNFSPARDVAEIAPRPILFIHGAHDPIIALERGRALNDAASAPKAHIWLDDLTDDQAVNDPQIVNRTRHFLDVAIPLL